MLNDVLAVCVAGAVVVVIATILGVVELLRKPVTAIAGRWSCLQAWLRLRTRPPTTTPRTAVMSQSIALLKSKAMARAHPCQTHEVWFGRRFVVDPPPHQTPSLALASAVPGQEATARKWTAGH